MPSMEASNNEAASKQNRYMEMVARAKANGYERRKHQEEDKKTDLYKHCPRTINLHKRVLDIYVTWRWDLQEERTQDGLPRLDWDTIYHEFLCEGAPAPSMEDVKDFLRFYLMQSKGRLKDAEGQPLKHATPESMKSTAEEFYRGIETETQTKVDVAQKTEIYRWVKKVLPLEGDTEDVCKEKYNFSQEELDRVLTVLWTKKDLKKIHERNRIQFHFLFLLYCWSGARSGTFFEKGLPYEDIQLVQRRRKDGQEGYEWIWRVTERWVKNNRDPRNKTFAITGKDHSMLIYNDGAFMLLLAIADKALFGIDSLDDLWQQEIPDGLNEKPYRWHDKWLKIPIARHINKAGIVDPVAPMKLGTFSAIFHDCLINAGYFGVSAGMHQIRRFLGKQVDKHYTETERSQHILHTDPRIFGASYVASTSSVAGKDAFLQQAPDHSVVDFFQGLGMFREEGLPTKLPAKMEAELLTLPDVVELDLRADGARDSDERTAAQRERQNLLKRLSRMKLVSYREQWVRQRRDWKILTKGKIPMKSTTDPDHLLTIMPERDRLSEKMGRMASLNSADAREAMQDMYTLLTRDYTVFYRIGEEPVGSLCPYCSKDLNEIEKRYRSSHIRSCSKTVMAAKLSQPVTSLVYCYDCAKWQVEDKSWDDHCQLHLSALPKSCGSITYCNTLVKPAHCPYCLGSKHKRPSERLRAWPRDADVIQHIEQNHVDERCWLCVAAGRTPTVATRDQVYYHLSDEHNLRCRQPSLKRKLEEGTSTQQNAKKMKGESTFSERVAAASSPMPWSASDALQGDVASPTESLDDFISKYTCLSPSPQLLAAKSVNPPPSFDEQIPCYDLTVSDSECDEQRWGPTPPSTIPSDYGGGSPSDNRVSFKPSEALSSQSSVDEIGSAGSLAGAPDYPSTVRTKTPPYVCPLDVVLPTSRPPKRGSPHVDTNSPISRGVKDNRSVTDEEPRGEKVGPPTHPPPSVEPKEATRLRIKLVKRKKIRIVLKTACKTAKSTDCARG